MVWNVYVYNNTKIEVYNIFKHSSFRNDVVIATLEYKEKEEFSKYIKSSLMYHFWSKAGWEVIVAPWCGGDRELDAVKIDVYEQVINNWDIFIDYVWNNREEFLVE